HIDTRLVVIGPVICVAALDAPLSSPPRLGDIPTAFFAAGNASVARWHVEEAGMFDESFREYGWEELEIGDRLRDMGLKRVTALRARGYRYCPPPQVSDLDLYLIRELERGRTAVAYFRKHPTFRARARVRLFPPLFWVDRILFPFEWYERPGFRRWLAGLEQRGRGRLLKAAIRFVMHHAYVSGLRQGLRR
ncbi:MAG: hypothetical protein H0Z37_08880, partial [Firmicutes bacterium]|nr:hypothetical protein [Bacillota bacterium]